MFRGRLLRTISKRIGNEPDAQDVLQEVFVRAVRNADSLAEARTPLAWLYTVTHSAIADHFRKKSRTPQGHDAGLETLIEPENEPEVEGLTRCLSPLVKALPSPYRQALTFTDLEGGKQTDYARLYQLKPSTARSHVQRGRGMLRKMVLGCCEVGLDEGHTISSLHPKQPECC